jgi:PAS domain S-box-containing protein
MKMVNRKISNILIIDDDKEFNNKLSKMFSGLGYLTTQFYTVQNSINLFRNFKNESTTLIILSNNKYSNNIFKYIQKKFESKIIILSEYEDIQEREHYFKNGILDYHLKSNNIDYIVDDIDELLKRLSQNYLENILVIDDSKVLCFAVKYLLEIRNYNVLTAHNARDGIDIFKTKNISLLILDMELPDMHGTDVLNTLRDVYYINNFPILVISGSNNPSMVREALKKGASDFLKKPFNYEEFLLKTDLWIKSSKWQKTIKQQKQQIENSLHSFKALVDSTIEALFIFEKDICVDVNNVAVELFGLNNKNDLLNKTIFEIFTNISPIHKKELVDNTIEYYFEDNIIHSDGSVLQVEIKERNIKLEKKALKIVAIMDLTQIKQKEQMLSNQSKMASMREIIGNIAHQWRQPLTAISVAAGGIKLGYELDMSDQEETLMELDNIVTNAQFLSDTIEDFQNFLNNDRITTNFLINETIDKTIAIIGANLTSSDIYIIKDYDQNIQISGIQNDLIQVLLNIINNSADILKSQQDLAKERYIIINSYIDSDFVIINIQDTAGGVPDDIINKVFEPYFTTKHQSQGTGLGLYMSHKIIVNTFKGKIYVINSEFEYNENKYYGAKFTIKVPLTYKAGI